jgi:hypothetical protein
VLEARYLSDTKSSLRSAEAKQGLQLEAIAVEAKVGQALGPKCVETVVDVRIPSAEQQIHQRGQKPVSRSPQPGEVLAPSSYSCSRAFGNVTAVLQSIDEARDVCGIGGAVCIQNHDEVAPRGGQTSHYCVALAVPGLLDDHDVR